MQRVLIYLLLMQFTLFNRGIASAIKEMLDALNDVCKKHKDFKKVSNFLTQ